MSRGQCGNRLRKSLRFGDGSLSVANFVCELDPGHDDRHAMRVDHTYTATWSNEGSER